MIFMRAAGGALHADTYYLLPEVIGTGPDPRIGSFVTRLHQGDNGASGSPLSVPLGLPIRRPAVIPAGTLRGRLSEVLPSNFVLVGNYCLFIPREFREEHRKHFPVLLDLLKKAAAEISGRPGFTSGWTELDLGDVSSDAVREIGYGDFHVVSGKTEDTLVVESAEKGNEKRPGISLSLLRYVRVFTTERAYQPGNRIDFSNLPVHYAEADANKNYLTEELSRDRSAAARYVSPGTILTAGDVRKEEIIRSGERVTVVVKRYPISMKLEAIAYGSGGSGDRIRVKPVRSNKSLYGKITANREVYVEDL